MDDRSASTQQALQAAVEAAMVAVAKASRLDGYEAVTTLAELLRNWAEEAADLRAVIVAEMYRRERITYDELGAQIGLSLPRTAELVKAGRAVGPEGRARLYALGAEPLAVEPPAVAEPAAVEAEPAKVTPAPRPPRPAPVSDWRAAVQQHAVRPDNEV